MKFSMVLFTVLLLTACSKESGQDHDEEVITTMTLKFTPVGGGATTSFSFDDPDGPGGIAPSIDEILLAPSTVYNVSLELYNKTITPVKDLTPEISSEGDAHRFYFEASSSSNITIANLNNDVNGIPLGLTSVWTTGANANGTVKITLRHYGGNPPNKGATDPVNSNKSSTDAEVTFTTRIQ